MVLRTRSTRRHRSSSSRLSKLDTLHQAPREPARLQFCRVFISFGGSIAGSSQSDEVGPDGAPFRGAPHPLFSYSNTPRGRVKTRFTRVPPPPRARVAKKFRPGHKGSHTLLRNGASALAPFRGHLSPVLGRGLRDALLRASVHRDARARAGRD